jgi:hypothetical protein
MGETLDELGVVAVRLNYIDFTGRSDLTYVRAFEPERRP